MASVRRYSPNAFEINQPSLKAILERIHNGEIQLPSFARNWCWSRDHVHSLLETIVLGHPMGVSTLVNATVADSRPFDLGLAVQNTKEGPMHLVLDGQQRLTAAYQACCASGVVQVNTSKGARRHRFFLDMEKAIDATIPMKGAIFSIELGARGRSGRRTEIECLDSANEYELGIVPASALLRFEAYELAFEQYWSKSVRSTRRLRALEKLRHFRELVESLERYKVPLQLFEQSMSPRKLSSAYANLNGWMAD